MVLDMLDRYGARVGHPSVCVSMLVDKWPSSGSDALDFMEFRELIRHVIRELTLHDANSWRSGLCGFWQ